MQNYREIDIETLRERFDEYIILMDEALDALKTFVEKHKAPDAAPLDHSLDSVDTLERVYRRVLDGELAAEPSIEHLRTRISSYLGETLRELAGGGHWTLVENRRDMNYGRPALTALPGFPEEYVWSPLTLVETFKHRPEQGKFREALQTHLDFIDEQQRGS